MMGLTHHQATLLRFIQDYSRDYGTAPTFDEMRAASGLASKAGIHRILTALEERGRIRRLHGRARAIEVVDAHLIDLEKRSNEELYDIAVRCSEIVKARSS